MACNSRKCWIIVVVLIAAIVGACIVIGLSMKTIQTYEVGVVYDTVGRRLGDSVRHGGLYALVPTSEILIFPNVFKAMTFTGKTEIECLNYDGVLVTLAVTYQFRPQENKVVDLILRYKQYENYEKLLAIAGRSAILKVCSTFNTYDIIARRADFTDAVKQKIETKYRELGSDISGLQVDNIARPDIYKEALRKKEASRENSVVKLNERKNLIINAETELAKAMSMTIQTLQQAEGDARVMKIEAKAKAEEIVKQFEVEAEIYKQLMDAGFTGKSLIAYLQVEAISSSTQPVFVGLEAPVNLTAT